MRRASDAETLFGGSLAAAEELNHEVGYTLAWPSRADVVQGVDSPLL